MVAPRTGVRAGIFGRFIRFLLDQFWPSPRRLSRRARGAARPARGGCRAGSPPRRPRCRRWGWPGRARARPGRRPASAASGWRRRGWPGRRRAGCRTAARRSRRAPGAPCSRVAKIEPPSSLATTMVRSGRGLAGAEDQGVASCRKVTSPTYAIARVLRGRPSAAPIALERVPSMPARPRLASTIRRSPTGWAVAIRSRSRIGLLAPTKSRPPGGLAALTAAATSYGVRPGWSADERVDPRGQRAVGRRATPRARRRRRRRRPARPPSCSEATGNGRSGQRPRARTETTSTSGARQQLRDRPGQRRVPEHDDPLDPGAEVGAEEQRGRCGSGWRRCGSRCWARRAAASRPRSASCRAGGPASSPATTTVRGPGAERVRGRCRRGPRVREHHVGSVAPVTLGVGRIRVGGVGSSGSSNWQLRWIGPSGNQAASRASSSGAVRSTKLAASPNRRTWSVVWLAPVPRRRAGRSAVTATRGTPAWAASSTAGCRLAAAVPDVVTTATGRCDPLASPRARNAGRPLVDPGVQGDPLVGGQGEGERRVARARGRAPRRSSPARPAGRPPRWRARSDGFTSDDPAARPRPRPSGGASAPPGRGPRPPGPAASGSTAGPTHGQEPVDRQQRRGHHVVGEQLHRGQPAGVGQLRQGRRQRDPGGDADARLHGARDHDRHADVLGDPQAGPDAAERLHLEHGDVGRLEVAHPVGVGRAPDRLVGGDRDATRGGVRARGPRPRRPAARRTPARRRPARARRSGAPPPRPTSRRWRRCGPARRGRARRGRPRAGPRPRPGPGRARRPSPWPSGSPTRRARSRRARSGEQAGTVTLTGTESSAAASGQPRSAASRAQSSQGAEVGASYSRNGLNSPQPAAPSSSTPSRTVMPRNRVRSGIEKTLMPSLGRQALERHAGRPCRWRAAGARRRGPPAAAPSARGHSSDTQSRRSSSATASDDEGDDALTPLARRVRRAPRPRTPPGARGSAPTTAGAGTFTPPVMIMSSSRPVIRSRPSSSSRPRSWVTSQPSRSTSRRSARGRPRSRRRASARAAAPARRRSGPRRRRSGTPVVHAAAAGLAHAVGRARPGCRPASASARSAGVEGGRRRSARRRSAASASTAARRPRAAGAAGSAPGET